MWPSGHLGCHCFPAKPAAAASAHPRHFMDYYWRLVSDSLPRPDGDRQPGSHRATGTGGIRKYAWAGGFVRRGLHFLDPGSGWDLRWLGTHAASILGAHYRHDPRHPRTVSSSNWNGAGNLHSMGSPRPREWIRI